MSPADQTPPMEKPLTTAEAVAAMKVHLHTIGGALARSVRWRSLAEMFDRWRAFAEDRRQQLRREAAGDG